MKRPTQTEEKALRERLIEAAIAETVEVGYERLSVEGIARRSVLPETCFHDHFNDKQAVVEAAYERLFERYRDRLMWTCAVQASWPAKVKVGIGVTLDMAAASPVAAQFFTVNSLAVSDELLSQVLDSRDRLARLLVAGRTETPHGPELPGVIEPVLISGIAGVISTQLRSGEAKSLPALAPQLVELVLTFYLGREEAAKVARRPRARVEDG